MGDKPFIILGTEDPPDAQDLIATGKMSRVSAVRIFSKYSDSLGGYWYPKAAVVPLDISHSDGSVAVSGRPFGNGRTAQLLEGCERAYLYYTTAGTEIENADIFDSSSMRDLFAFASMLKITQTLRDYFVSDLHMSDPENLLTENGRELSVEDMDLIRDLGRDAMEAIGITYDSRGLMKPWNTLMGIMYDKEQSFT